MTEAVAITGVGQELAAAREARGLALADVAQSLKFAPRQLEALEQERFDALPGATFARGMVRSYARLLKLDPEPLVERISGRCEVPDSSRLADRYHQPVPFSDNGRRLADSISHPPALGRRRTWGPEKIIHRGCQVNHLNCRAFIRFGPACHSP